MLVAMESNFVAITQLIGSHEQYALLKFPGLYKTWTLDWTGLWTHRSLKLFGL